MASLAALWIGGRCDERRSDSWTGEKTTKSTHHEAFIELELTIKISYYGNHSHMQNRLITAHKSPETALWERREDVQCPLEEKLMPNAGVGCFFPWTTAIVSLKGKKQQPRCLLSTRKWTLVSTCEPRLTAGTQVSWTLDHHPERQDADNRPLVPASCFKALARLTRAAHRLDMWWCLLLVFIRVANDRLA